MFKPGNFIVSTFGDHVTVDPTPSVGTAQTRVASSYTGNVVYGTTTGWAFLSGTSMAAPHVAGAAAYLADRFNLTTPAAIEAKVRQCSTAYFNDQGGSAAKIIQLPDAQDCN